MIPRAPWLAQLRVLPAHAGMIPVLRAAPRASDVLPAHAGMIPPGRARRTPMAKTVLPAHAGMIRLRPASTSCSASAPRSRGDDPRYPLCDGAAPARAPRSRGDDPPRQASPDPRPTPVLPAHAGMIRPARATPQVAVLPAHAGMIRRRPRRGGRAPAGVLPAHAGMIPRTFGVGGHASSVLPAHAGMIPSRSAGRHRSVVLPAHAGMIRTATEPSCRWIMRLVLPAHAGMIPSCVGRPTVSSPCSPLTRG